MPSENVTESNYGGNGEDGEVPSLGVNMVDLDWSVAKKRFNINSKSTTEVHVDDLFPECPSFRASKLQIDAGSSGKQFHVLLDGELFGPFFRVRFSPLRISHAQSPPVTFPVYSFA